MVASPISGAIGGFAGGSDGKSIIDSVQDGLLRGSASLTIDLIGKEAGLDPLTQSLIANSLTGGLLGTQQNGNFLQGALDSFLRSGLNAFTFDSINYDVNSPYTSYNRARYLASITEFNDEVRQVGFVNALEQHASSIFQRDAIENIFKEGGIINFINGNAITVNVEGINLTKLTASDGTELFFDQATDEMKGRRFGNVEEFGTRFGFNQDGEFGLIEGSIKTTAPDGSYTVEKIKDGLLLSIDLYEGGELKTSALHPFIIQSVS